jgi:hypothetical protein
MSLVDGALESPGWRQARRSMGNGNCVEVRPATGAIVVRDSQNPNGPVLAYSAETWRAFTLAARLRHFDVPSNKDL